MLYAEGDVFAPLSFSSFQVSSCTLLSEASNSGRHHLEVAAVTIF